jgi:hypothetical protein
MSENQKRILQMVADGKISVDEATRLLALIEPDRTALGAADPLSPKSAARYLRVIVEPKTGAMERKHGRVNVRVPIVLIKAGIKLATLIPPEAADKVNSAMKEKGMTWDMRNLKAEDIEAILAVMHESEIYIDTDDETVKLYAE